MGNKSGSLSLAYKCLDNKDYFTAIALFENTENENLLSGDDYYHLALCYNKINDIRKFNINYKKAIEKNSYIESITRKNNIENIKKYATALLGYGRASQTDRAVMYAQIYIYRTKYYSALQYYDLLKILSKNNMEIDLLYSVCYFHINNVLDDTIIDLINDKSKYYNLKNIMHQIITQEPKIIQGVFVEAIADILYHNEDTNKWNYYEALYLYLMYTDLNKNIDLNYKIAMCYYKLNNPNYIKFYIDSIESGSLLEIKHRDTNTEILQNISHFLRSTKDNLAPLHFLS